MAKNYDLVQEYLKEQFQPSHVVKMGLKGLVMNWEKVVHELVFDGYRYGLRDFVNDLDRRVILDGALQFLATKGETPAPEMAVRVSGADLKYKNATCAADRCILDDETVAERKVDPIANWYFFRVPRRHRSNFAKDLDAAGITFQKS